MIDKRIISIIAASSLCYLGYAHGHHDDNDDHIEMGKTGIYAEINGIFNQYDIKTQAIIATLIVSIIPVIIMSAVYGCLNKLVGDPKESLLIQIMYAFTFGALAGDVFFHIFPSINENFTRGGEIYDEAEQIYVHYYFIGGMVFYYLLEVVINKFFGGDCHDHSDEKEVVKKEGHSSQVILALLGDLFHNFTDGLAIASTYSLSPKLGFVTAIACFVHEFPHEIGDFAYLYKNGYSYFHALTYQLITGGGAILGAMACLNFSGNATIEMVALSAGSFCYMALLLFLNDLRTGNKISWAIINAVFIFLGLYSMHLVALLEEH